jgi:hypothetical protein
MGLYPSGAGCAVCAPVAGATQVKCYNGDTSLPVSCTPGLFVDVSICSSMDFFCIIFNNEIHGHCTDTVSLDPWSVVHKPDTVCLLCVLT